VPVASVIVVIELLIISWLRFHYFRMLLLRSAVQVIVGGALRLCRRCGDRSLVNIEAWAMDASAKMGRW
jgi:hypothetical protein